MNKKLLINIGLLAFIVLLVIVGTSTNEEESQETIIVPDFDIASINDIVITRKDKPELHFNKQGEIWRMESPLKIRVNIARINAMLKLAVSESHGQFNKNEVDLAELGLVTPKISMTLNNVLFKFGVTDGIDQRRYVLYDDTVFMVNDFLYAQLDSKPGFFADTQLLPEGTKLKQIEFPNNTFTLKNNVWTMQQLMDIKPDQLKRLAFSWENAAAISVSSYQQPQQYFPIILTTSDDKIIRYEIISNNPYLILGRKDLEIQYHMGSDEAEKLLFQENEIKKDEQPTDQ